MAVTLLWQKTKVAIGSLELDASLSEQHQADVDVTDHPVEQGVDISDHMQPKPEVLTLEGCFTNTPIPGPADSLQTRSVQTPRGLVQYDSRAAEEPGHAENAHAQLRAFKDGGELLTVVTPLRTYQQVALVSLNVPRDSKFGQALRFTAVFRQVRTVENKTVQLDTAEPNGKKKVNLGAKATPDAEDKRTILKALADGVRR